MKNLPTILEEEGKLFDDNAQFYDGKYHIFEEKLKSFLLASHKRVIEQLGEMIEKKKRKWPEVGTVPNPYVEAYNEAVSDVLLLIQEGLEQKFQCQGCKTIYPEYVNGCPKCWDSNLTPEENRKKFPNRGVRPMRV